MLARRGDLRGLSPSPSPARGASSHCRVLLLLIVLGKRVRTEGGMGGGGQPTPSSSSAAKNRRCHVGREAAGSCPQRRSPRPIIRTRLPALSCPLPCWLKQVAASRTSQECPLHRPALESCWEEQGGGEQAAVAARRSWATSRHP